MTELEPMKAKEMLDMRHDLQLKLMNRNIRDFMAATVLMEKGFKEEDIFEPKSLKSVSKLEKLGQKGQVVSILGDLIVRPEGAPKLVRDALIEEDFK